MDNNQEKTPGVSHDTYIALMNSITNMEDRLRWSELIYLLLNIVVLLFSVLFISSLIHKVDYYLTYIDLTLIFSCLMIGMSIDAHWVASVMRAQLKLKLRYFQARSMERMFNNAGEYIFSDESVFFNPDIRRLESPDNKESLQYPTSGLARMDGFIGSAKPRYFSWMLPCLFIAIYWFIFFVVLTKV
ncbi:MAG: hypothetical protein AB1306_08685 [Nitrospirota bacterium]